MLTFVTNYPHCNDNVRLESSGSPHMILRAHVPYAMEGSQPHPEWGSHLLLQHLKFALGDMSMRSWAKCNNFYADAYRYKCSGPLSFLLYFPRPVHLSLDERTGLLERLLKSLVVCKGRMGAIS